MAELAEPRFVVRELEGYKIDPAADIRSTQGGRTLPSLTVWVADEAYNGRGVKTWRTERAPGVGKTRADRFAKARSEAAALAASLNAGEAHG